MREKSSSFLEGWAGWLGRSRLRLASAQMSYGRGSWRSTVPVFRVPCSASPVESQWLKLLKLWNRKLSIPVQPSPGHGSCTRHCLFVVLLCVAFEAHSSWWLRDLPETLDSLSQIPEPGPDDSCDVTLFMVPLPHFHLCHITNGGGSPKQLEVPSS